MNVSAVTDIAQVLKNSRIFFLLLRLLPSFEFSIQVIYDGPEKEDEFAKNVASVIVELGFTAVLLPPSSSSRLLVSISPVSAAARRQSSSLPAEVARKLADGKLLAVPAGVLSASFQQSSSILTIDYDPAQIGARVLLRAVQQELGNGYTVSLSTATTRSSGERELVKWQLYFLWSLALGLPILFITIIFRQVHSTKRWLDKPIITQGLNSGNLIGFILATPVQLIIGWPLYVSAWKSLRYSKSANMDALIILSTSTAYVYSVLAVIVAMARDRKLAEGSYYICFS